MTALNPIVDETGLQWRAAQATRLNRFLEEFELDVTEVEADPSLLEPICDLSGQIIPDFTDFPKD
jgi:hypothetical protein